MPEEKDATIGPAKRETGHELPPNIEIKNPGQKFEDALAELEKKPRKNKIVSWVQDETTGWKKHERCFSEEEGLVGLKNFLDKAAAKTTETDNEEILERITAFRKNLVFIGERDLQEATAGIAEHLAEHVDQGKKVYLYVPSSRSEQYISLRILEEYEKIAGSSKAGIFLSEDSALIARTCAREPNNSVVVVADDFAISGTRAKGLISKTASALAKRGKITKETAAKMVECCLVAFPIRENNIITWGDSKIFAYYGTEEYRGHDHKWVVYPGVSITGAHSSTDYGFETFLEDLQKFLKENGEKVELPLLCNIKRPYERNNREYLDPNLQARWERVAKKYQLHQA